MPAVKKRVTTNDPQKLKINFDIPTLNAFIKYMQCDIVPSSAISNLFKLMNGLDIASYNYNYDIQIRLRSILAYTRAVIEKNIKDPDVIMANISSEDSEAGKFLTTELKIERNTLSTADCKSITDAVSEKLQCVFIFKVKDSIIDLLEKVNDTSLVSYYQVIEDLKQKISELNMKLQSTQTTTGLIRTFNFTNDDYARLLNVIVDKAKKPSSILQTGIRQLNAILSPGFQSTRLYTFLGGTGKFKSGTLLNMADNIRKYNPQIIPYENGLRKTICFVTLENTIEETIVRLFDMYSDENENIYNMSYDDVKRILEERGQFKFSTNEGIDIDFFYFQNLEIATSELYNIVNRLRDEGKQTICLILDYLLRIQSVAPNNGEERIRVSYAAKELKSLAQHFEIPVITAMQLNREGNSIIDAAMRDDKQDVARFVGSSSVGIAWNVIEESDWVCMINPEMQKSTGEQFLTFKRLKIRYKKDPFAVDYFNHPFTNKKNIRLAPDIQLEKTLSIMSLASDLETVIEKEFDNETRSRPKVSFGKKSASILQSIPLPSIMDAA